jgi:hypothetical protein
MNQMLRERNQQQLVAAYREHLALAGRYQINNASRVRFAARESPVYGTL